MNKQSNADVNAREAIIALLHDIRNPLNNISINADLARLLIASEVKKEDSIAVLDTISSQCQKLSELILAFENDQK